ncbi:hypothetical protein KIW84_023555 [Lathyrus oleraceus]|uniref:Uncharacterized protein n=1 Tax=Pisum sativum TaxID=3888 RepID=A0A9D4YH52_PEA|nr:hypothetical protein KIW84_023555 [Pisum sativum]
MWFQRSRVKWLADGDCNIKYYHLETINRRKKNVIVMLKEDQDIDELDQQVINDEIKRSLFDMKSWKVPGLDEFPAGFYQKSWDIVGKNVFEFVKCIGKQPNQIGEVNKNDICLIPKGENPTIVMSFRPVSLCNTNYKVISKVLVGRSLRNI